MFLLSQNIEQVMGEIQFPSNSHRIQGIPTYCIVDPEGMKTSDRSKYINLAKEGVLEWNGKLTQYEKNNPNIWRIDLAILSPSEDTSNCSIVINFTSKIEKPDDEGFTTIGLFNYFSQTITIAVDDILEGKIYNIILHEIGHSFGLGHYTSDNNDENKKWHSGNSPAPSIMVPTTHNNPSLSLITKTDINKIKSIYGSDGFYAFSPSSPIIPKTPSTPKPIIPVQPIIPVKPFVYYEISNSDITIKKYDTQIVKISGFIQENIFHKGHSVSITIQNPTIGFTVYKVQPTQTGYFELPLKFDNESERGWYRVQGSYMEHVDHDMAFDFEVSSKSSDFKKDPIHEPEKNEKEEKYGTYLENIQIEKNNRKYTVTANMDRNSFNSDIGITANNACPFEKQVFQKDYKPNTLTKILFSFDQLSKGKPDQCTINFIIKNFDGRVLDFVSIKYDPHNTKILDYPKQSQNTIIPKININPTSMEEQKQKKKLQNEVEILQQESHYELEKFQKENQSLKEKLEQLSSIDTEDKNRINQVWNKFKENQVMLDENKKIIKNGDRELGKENYEIAKNTFTKIETNHDEIEKHQKFMLGLIDVVEKHETEKSKPPSCFLWWCW
jgi:hypothetical protein